MSLIQVSAEISLAEQASGCAEGSVELIAVSKVQPNERVLAVLNQGHHVFGENRVQEAEGKWPEFKSDFPDARVHLLGPLQSNKARAALQLFDCIHTLDRPKLAAAFARLAQELGHCPPMFAQVNTGLEDQKAGIAPEAVDSFVADCRALDLPLVGLMCIPPVDEEASMHFALLAKLAKRNDLAQLSMGMSGDFAKAIAFGATHVRVGSAIFGARVPATPSE
ncbi:YggS family pyridoxal phosphate-dependent enzyme [uncultured Planktomarina sp.]|jgi:PLP dependent protein|uniref:YggS family pyridoxal phosphate-dependent enzyme n=1 Tax=uncultured Planktomarina sp. TaxID=1538529 RepID=UPI003261B0B5